MRKILVTLIVAGALSFPAISMAAGQNGESAVVKVPFQFVVGNKVMPAGSYRISPQTGNWSVLVISSLDGSAAVFASTQAAVNPASNDETPRVKFTNYFGQYFLQSVALPSRDAREVLITKAQAEQTLAKLNLMPAEHAATAK